jgi:hypothetical protein
MSDRYEPAGTYAYRWHPQSPDYEDPADGLEDMTVEDLYTFRAMAESAAENPDVPRATRHHCEASAKAMLAEIIRRKREEGGARADLTDANLTDADPTGAAT